jgi:hypothetical protein
MMNSAMTFSDNDPFGTDRINHDGSGYVIIRLAEKETDDTDDLRELALKEEFESLRSFLADNAQLTPERVIRHAAPGFIREREQHAAQSLFVPAETLTAYWRIKAHPEENPETLRKTLHRMPEISVAYHETLVREANAPVDSADANPYYHDQGFLNAKPQGIGAREAWASAGCGGSGVKVIDLEAGWILTHQDLPAPKLLYGDNGFADQYVSGNHGAAALGIIAGVNNTLGIIGIAPNLDSLHAVSHYDASIKTGLHVADAIAAAINFLDPGDILLLEVQRSDGGKVYPTEIDSADLHAIRLAAAYGIIVIEAAGNGGQNLDAWSDATDQHSLKVNASAYSDSGAIMVGAASAPAQGDTAGFTGHQRYYTSNFGSRVNVYAWGERIYTAGYGTIAGQSGSVDSYTSNFGQTSGASAIIAGAAALVQSWHKSAFGATLTPAAMRQILSKPETATPQALAAGDHIGVMPDVGAIVCG